MTDQTKRIALILTLDEYAEIMAAAKAASMPIATFIRSLALKAMRG